MLSYSWIAKDGKRKMDSERWIAKDGNFFIFFTLFFLEIDLSYEKKKNIRSFFVTFVVIIC